ncbi:cellulose biosynthesis protein BcsQ [Clostridiales Family XIII bacterium PM5-7]
MKIHKAKTSNYDLVDNENLRRYILDYIEENIDLIKSDEKKLEMADRRYLKSIAADLENVNKKLKWIIQGRY